MQTVIGTLEVRDIARKLNHLENAQHGLREEVTGWRMIDQGAEFTSEGLVLDVEGQAYAAHKEQSDTAHITVKSHECPTSLILARRIDIHALKICRDSAEYLMGCKISANGANVGALSIGCASLQGL
ncbi:hypothetical protein PCH_Pc20g10460 [Penicillium rubens Wisconsin 54-1255]|uniref:Uncharacterized protein n=1 Tax=Penicillium rubens (strain ATCC 28089 / DSM 1075 / NRRL 1951 / Wisconsin 54-1255) TaxID=500485 RepID=B6HFU1_PENRW|nr:hypothetical protein PCH_Pc20g10460 [Penicillium rubens Wisconsin 54-1255]